MKKKFTTIFLSLAVFITAALFINARDDYFEISKNLDIFASLYREINTNYVDQTKPGELMNAGIEAMLESLDPYTNFIPESKIEDYRFMTTGQYGGIGAIIQKRKDKIIVAEIYDGFPADKGGLYIGDEILEIDGLSTEGKNTSEISEVLKGQPETMVDIKVRRGAIEDGEVLLKKIHRAEIKIHDVPYYSMISDKVGYIRLTGFTPTASTEFLAAMKELKEEKGMESLIVDLRGNGGGLLRESVSIVNFFVNKGTPVVSTRGKLKEWEQHYKAERNPYDSEIPLAILVDEFSASASEIVAGSIQDLDRGVIIGKETFGKGLVQQTVDLSYNSKLKVTVAKYYTPSGRCIQKLNYSDRNETGKAQEIPDSLIGEFKSLNNGRPLFDGNGIKPDLIISEDDYSSISIELLQEYYIFDYATKYRLSNEKIAEPGEFEITDAEMENFKKYLNEQEFNHSTDADVLMEQLKKTSQDEDYYALIESDYQGLENKLNEVKNKDFEKHKKEISNLLSSELVMRYHHQKGRLEYGLAHDAYVNVALDILGEKATYDSILKGTYSSED